MSPVRQRITAIRRRVAVVAVTMFFALFSAIYVQMASGNDPVLGSGTTTAAKTTSSSTSSSSDQSSSSSGSSSLDQSSSSDAPSAVTTRQS
jgi:hypothetical protein